MRIRWRWYDLWVGAYFDRKERRLYVCPFPTVVLEFCFHRWTGWLSTNIHGDARLYTGSLHRASRACTRCGTVQHRFFG